MSGEGGASITSVLELLEKHGTVVVLAHGLETIAPREAREALHAAGVVAAAPPAVSWPCEVRGCSREIRANHDGARRPLVAVCCQVPAECTPVELGFDAVAQQEISVAALVTAACGLLGVVVDRASMAKVRERRVLGESRAPVLVASAQERDLFWAGSPRDTDLAAWCARRERVAKKALVLVPTGKHLSIDVASRFTVGEQVEVRALSELLVVRDGALALRDEEDAPHTPRNLAPEPPPPSALPSALGLAALLRVTKWEEIRLTQVDGVTLRIEANGQTLLRTFVELGFVDGRKTALVTPTKAWSVLLLFCKQKRIKPSEYRDYGKAYGVKKAIERLGSTMRASFGIAEHPIHAYSKRGRLWEARFQVTEGKR